MQRSIMATGIVGALTFCGAAFGQEAMGGTAPPNKAAAENVPEFRDPTNAALVYWPTFWALGEDARVKLSDAYQGFKDDLFARPSAEASQLIASRSDMVDQIIRASEIRHADWGVEWSRGFYARLEHLGKLRMTSRFVAVDARRLVAAGDPDAAADRVAAMHRIARHASPDGTLISALVGASISNIACTETEMLLADGRMTAKGKQEILDALSWFDGPDPFRIRFSILGEKQWTSSWLRQRATGAEAGKTAMKLITDLSDDAGKARLAATGLADMDERAVHAELDKLDGFFIAAIEAWDAPNAAERIRSLNEQASAEKYGVFFTILAPALQKTYESDQKARTRLNDVRARVQSFAPASAAPTKSPDASGPSK